LSPEPVIEVESGDAVELKVRLTNKTGHKLPTGYPEGRRVYLEVSVKLKGSSSQIISGHWDPATGDLVEDDQLRTYETKHGRVGEGRTQHLALANQILLDTRIPPEGFRPSAADMHPAGRDYGTPPYRHWDEHVFRIPIPGGIQQVTTGTITIRALHQITSGRYVRFLLESLGDDDPRARKLQTAYVALGKVPPEPMVSVAQPIVVLKKTPAPVTDAGFSPDAMRMQAMPTDPNSAGSCSCKTSGQAHDKWNFKFLFLLLFLASSVVCRRHLTCKYSRN